MSSRRKYQNGSGYRSKRSGRNSEFHWGYVAVPAVVGVAGVTTLAIVLSKNKSKPGKDGAKGESGSKSASPSNTNANGANDKTVTPDSVGPTVYEQYIKAIKADRRFKKAVDDEFKLKYNIKAENLGKGYNDSGEAQGEKDTQGWVYNQTNDGLDLAEAAVLSYVLNSNETPWSEYVTPPEAIDADGIVFTAKMLIGFKVIGPKTINLAREGLAGTQTVLNGIFDVVEETTLYLAEESLSWGLFATELSYM